MESSSGDLEESTEDTPGSKKSVRINLLRKSKRAGEEQHAKLSQSASDITAGEGLGSNEDLSCSHRVMGSRALSHDSIFLDDEVLTDIEPARVLSQENVHSKIKALQIKLQQQKMHLGPPPLVLPLRRPDNLGGHLGDGGLPPSTSPEVTGSDDTAQRVLSKASQPSSCPLSSIPIPALAKYVAPHPSHPLPASVPSVTEPTLDFSSPPQFTPCLDTSAARHRMSVKPRNQRATTKKRVATTYTRLPSYTPNNTDHSESMNEEGQSLCPQDNVTLETDHGEADIPAQHVPSKFPKVEPVASETPTKLSSSQQEPASPRRAPPTSTQALRLKPQRPVELTSSERPHSSFIESELISRRDPGFEIQVLSYEKRNVFKKTGMTQECSDKLSTVSSSNEAFRPSTVPQQVQEETETTKGMKRPAPGSGSFHFSITTAKNRDGTRPRSSSFVVIREQAEATHEETEDKSSSSLREKGELRDVQPRGSPFTVGRLKQDRAPLSSSLLQWERRGSLKKTEGTSSASKNEAADTGSSAKEGVEKSQREVEKSQKEVEKSQKEVEKSQREVKKSQEEVEKSQREVKKSQEEVEKSQREVKKSQEEVEKSQREVKKSQEEVEKSQREVKRNQEEVEEAVEAQEEVQGEEGKMAFGIKLRSTSQSRRFRHEATFNHLIKSPECDDQCDKQNKQEKSEHMGLTSQKTPTTQSASPSTSAEVRAAVRNNLPSTGDSRVMPAEVLTEPQPQPASSEVSWMSFAMEKTRSLQQLFTSRFPSATRPQAQAQPTNPTEPQAGAQMQKQSSAAAQSSNPPLTVQSASQTVKPSQVSAHQKTSTASPGLSKAFTEAQTSKQSSESQSHLNTTQCPAHPHDQTKSWKTHSLRSCTQTESSSHPAQGSSTHCPAQSHLSLGQHVTAQQPPWSNRVLPQTSQPKSTTLVSTTPSVPAAPPPGGEEGDNVQEKEGPSPSEIRAVWGGSVIKRAAFLEKMAERTSPAVSKEVDLKKVQQTQAQTSDESPASAKTAPVSTDTKPEGRQGWKPAESAPTKVPDRPREDKWIRKNVATSSPSSFPTQTTVLQSMSDSGQPSWMELAKRKSMAWSDKTMD